MNREEIITQLTAWIDPQVVAIQIVDAVDESEATLTLEKCQAVYLRFLESSLWSGLATCTE